MDVIQQSVAVAAVLGLLGATLWWLRRGGYAGWAPNKKAGGRRLEALERLPLGPQHTLHLVRVGEIELLLASYPAGCALVHSFPRQEVRP